MLIREGTALTGEAGHILGSPLKARRVIEKLAVGTPVGAFLGLFSQTPQVRNRLLAIDAAVLGGIHQEIHKGALSATGDHGKGLTEFLQAAHTTSKEMAEGQLHHPTVGLVAIEVSTVQ